MAAPKSQVKISYKKGKTEVTYESNLDATQYYIFELSRAALRDVGKFVAKKFRELYYQHFERHTGDGGKAVVYQAISSKNTKYPRLQVGLPHSRRGVPVKGFYAYFQEFGSSKQQKLGLLTHAVQDNIPEIIKIESTYLSGLSGEAQRLNSQISENEYTGDADD